MEGDTLREFYRIVTPFLLPDGAVAVPLWQARMIRVFDKTGAYVRTLGGPGAGPGEFTSLQGAWSRGDTVEAFSPNEMRITRFLPDGRVEAVFLEGVGFPQSVLGTLGEGWVISGVESVPTGRRDQMKVHRYARSGAHMGEIGALEGMLRFRTENAGGPTPLSPKWLLAQHAGNVYIGDSMEPTIHVVDSAGAPVREVTWQPGPTPPVESTLRAVIDSVVARSDRSVFMQRDYIEAAPVPDRLSVAWGLLVDAEGFVWVRPYDPMRNAAALGGLGSMGRGGTWKVFAPDGTPAGEVSVPDELEPVQITRDAVLGIVHDELGVEYVRVYALERR